MNFHPLRFCIYDVKVLKEFPSCCSDLCRRSHGFSQSGTNFLYYSDITRISGVSSFLLNKEEGSFGPPCPFTSKI